MQVQLTVQPVVFRTSRALGACQIDLFCVLRSMNTGGLEAAPNGGYLKSFVDNAW
jgi:hypothetical protein